MNRFFFPKSMAWHKKMDTNNILKWQVPEVLKKYYPGGYCNEDKEGCPIWFELLGYADLKGRLTYPTRRDVEQRRNDYLFS